MQAIFYSLMDIHNSVNQAYITNHWLCLLYIKLNRLETLIILEFSEHPHMYVYSQSKCHLFYYLCFFLHVCFKSTKWANYLGESCMTLKHSLLCYLTLGFSSQPIYIQRNFKCAFHKSFQASRTIYYAQSEGDFFKTCHCPSELLHGFNTICRSVQTILQSYPNLKVSFLLKNTSVILNLTGHATIFFCQIHPIKVYGHHIIVWRLSRAVMHVCAWSLIGKRLVRILTATSFSLQTHFEMGKLSRLNLT